MATDLCSDLALEIEEAGVRCPSCGGGRMFASALATVQCLECDWMCALEDELEGYDSLEEKWAAEFARQEELLRWLVGHVMQQALGGGGPPGIEQ